jgi:hypothetical protein
MVDEYFRALRARGETSRGVLRREEAMFIGTVKVQLGRVEAGNPINVKYENKWSEMQRGEEGKT